jgi:hypothetical protein
MSKFVRIDKAEDPKKALMLNLDLVATVEFSLQDSLKPHGTPRASVSFYSSERMTVATLYFDSVDEGNRWVLQHLGVEL